MKLQLALVAAALLCGGSVLAQDFPNLLPKPKPPTKAQIAQQERENLAALAEAYTDLNHDYMLDQLPKKIHIKVADHLLVNGDPAMGFTKCNNLSAAGRGSDCTIYLGIAENGYNMRSMVFTLYHEACHIPTYGLGHGREWQECMVRLANKGAFEFVW